MSACFICMCVLHHRPIWCLHVCIACTMHIYRCLHYMCYISYTWCLQQSKGVSGPLELQMFVSHHVGSQTLSRNFCSQISGCIYSFMSLICRVLRTSFMILMFLVKLGSTENLLWCFLPVAFGFLYFIFYSRALVSLGNPIRDLIVLVAVMKGHNQGQDRKGRFIWLYTSTLPSIAERIQARNPVAGADANVMVEGCLLACSDFFLQNQGPSAQEGWHHSNRTGPPSSITN